MLMIKRYIRGVQASIGIMFALMAPVMVGAMGLALDYSQAYLVQQRLAQALDAAALAAASSATDKVAIEAKVQQFFDANYPPEKLGFTFDPVVTINGNQITVSGVASYSTFFAQLIGNDEVTVTAETTVERAVKGLEVVLVLDNTGSMATNDNIGKLRTATCEFVEILYGTYDAEETTDCLERYDSFVDAQNEYVKVGLVPYATSVNVGPYGLGYDDDGYGYGSAFLNNPLDLEFSNDGNTDICIIENDDGTDVLDHSGPWYMYRWCRGKTDDSPQCNYYNNYVCKNNAYNSSGSNCLDWDYDYGERTVYRAPEYRCPKASILPMTENMTALKDRINEMEANGWTFGNLGMVWGWRMLSPEAPFTEGVEWDNPSWRKVIVMMTDGDNVRSSPYGGYGNNNNHSVYSSNDLDDRLEDVCQNMNDQDRVTVYTITFDVNGGIDSTTEALYAECAGNGGFHSHVTTSEDLIEVFREIAQELSNLHIKQ